MSAHSLGSVPYPNVFDCYAKAFGMCGILLSHCISEGTWVLKSDIISRVL